jgi:hypothetical protein
LTFSEGSVYFVQKVEVNIAAGSWKCRDKEAGEEGEFDPRIG